MNENLFFASAIIPWMTPATKTASDMKLKIRDAIESFEALLFNSRRHSSGINTYRKASTTSSPAITTPDAGVDIPGGILWN